MKKNVVSEKISTLLNDRNISVEELSKLSGLTESQISLILESEKIPSLAPLIKIARGLGLRLGTFLDDSENIGPVVHRLSDKTDSATFSSQLSTSNSHLDFYSLAGNKAGRHMEPFIIDIKPSDTNEPILSSHEGEEFIFVISGEVKIIYGKETYVLQKGESIYYDSIVDHLVSAVSDNPAQIVAVVYTPI